MHDDPNGSMTPPVPRIHSSSHTPALFPLVAQVAQPIGVALLVAVVTFLTLFELIRGFSRREAEYRCSSLPQRQCGCARRGIAVLSSAFPEVIRLVHGDRTHCRRSCRVCRTAPHGHAEPSIVSFGPEPPLLRSRWLAAPPARSCSADDTGAGLSCRSSRSARSAVESVSDTTSRRRLL